MAATRGHARKRPFQPSIDSYFNRDASSSSSAYRSSRAEAPLAPSLPAETQASLLSVGMRVRKSVPEGYKTHKTIGVHISPIPSSAPARLRTKPKQRHGDVNQTELIPMCGLHKTGGFAAQVAISSAPVALYIEEEDSDGDEDGLPHLSASQSTLQSTIDSFTSASPGSSGKRGYEEEMEEELGAYFDDDTAMDSHVSDAMTHDRAMARTKLPYRGETCRVGGLGGGNDFDEAAFLVADGMDVDDA